MKKLLLLSLLLCTSFVGFSQKGIGVRLGDPSGVSFKVYNGDKAFELSFGRSYLTRGKGYYSDNFFKWYSDATLPYSDYKYVGTKSSFPFGVQLLYLIHEDWFAEEFDGLQWYYGFGGQFGLQSFTHEYQYKVKGNPIWFNGEGQRVTDIDLGGDAVIGAEYEFPDVPIRVYTDLTLYMEIVDDPFRFRLIGGLGGRYMF